MSSFKSTTESITIHCGLCGQPIKDISHGVAFWPKESRGEVIFVHDYCDGYDICFFSTVFQNQNWVRLNHFFEEIAHQMIIGSGTEVDIKYLSYCNSFNRMNNRAAGN